MIKYAIYKETAQLDYDTTYTKEEIWEAYNRQSFVDPMLVGYFETLDDAKKAFEWEIRYLYTTKEKGFGSTVFLKAEIVYLQEEEWEDDEFIQALNIWNYAVEPYNEK